MKLNIVPFILSATLGSTLSAALPVVMLDMESLHSTYTKGDTWGANVSFFDPVQSAWSGDIAVKAGWQGDGGVYAPGGSPTYMNSTAINSMIDVVSNDGSFHFNNDPDASTFSSFFLDFAGLTDGVLPAGTLMFFGDAEYSTSANFSAPGGAWLSIAGTGDYIAPADPAISTASLAFTGGGTYSVFGAPVGGNGNFLLLETTRDVTSFKMEGYHEDAGVFGISLMAPAMVSAIPEPSRILLLGLASLGLMAKHRR